MRAHIAIFVLAAAMWLMTGCTYPEHHERSREAAPGLHPATHRALSHRGMSRPRRPSCLSAAIVGKTGTGNRASTIVLGDNAPPHGYPLNSGVLRR